MIDEKELAAAILRGYSRYGQQGFDHDAATVKASMNDSEWEEFRASLVGHPKPEEVVRERAGAKKRAAAKGILDDKDWTAANVDKLDDKAFDRNFHHRLQSRRGMNGRP